MNSKVTRPGMFSTSRLVVGYLNYFKFLISSLPLPNNTGVFSMKHCRLYLDYISVVIINNNSNNISSSQLCISLYVCMLECLFVCICPVLAAVAYAERQRFILQPVQ